jgi:excinuclease ABC subunit A
VIEHDLDVVAEADWIIDLGPEGGAQGGKVVAATTPERLAALPASHTGAALKPVLARGARTAAADLRENVSAQAAG